MTIKELKDYLALSGGLMHKKSRTSNRTPNAIQASDDYSGKIKVTISGMKTSTFK